MLFYTCDGFPHQLLSYACWAHLIINNQVWFVFSRFNCEKWSCYEIKFLQDLSKSQVLQFYQTDSWRIYKFWTSQTVSWFWNFTGLWNRSLIKPTCRPPISLPQTLVVANGGLGNGVSREELSAALGEMGELETLIMHPHKPYAFVTYRYRHSCHRCDSCKLFQPLWKILV